MNKKYKSKNKNGTLFNPFYIFFLSCILLLFIPYGYSLLSETVTIKGKANILPNISPEYGNSTYSWSLLYEWGGSGSPKFYQVEIPILNLDGDIASWEIKFDVPNGFLVDQSNIWQSSSITLSGNTITLLPQSWNQSLANGETLSLNMQLAFENEINLDINNLILNGKLVTLKKE